MGNLEDNKRALQNLERLHKLAVEEGLQFPFFKMFQNYIAFTFQDPILKKIIEEQMTQRNARYEKIEEADKKATKEMRIAKSKILSIIKDKKIDTDNFFRHSTMSLGHTDDESGRDILKELEALETKKVIIHSSNPYSSELQAYLYDISANLLKLNYEKDLGNLIVPQKEYATYYQRIEGTSGYFFSNTNGTFIFSKTWPEIFENKNLLKRERALKSWGAFERATQFMRAHFNVMTNVNTWKITEVKSPYDYLLRPEDLPDVFHMTEDFYHISGQSREDNARKFKGQYSSELDLLDHPSFKHHLQTIHEIFRQSLETEAIAKGKNTENKKIKEITFVKKKTEPKTTYDFYINGNLKDIKPLRSDSSRLRKLAELAEGKDLDYDKDFLDYVNSNSNCALYCARKYELTKILEKNGSHLRICYGTQVKIIGEVEYRKKLNKKNKT